MYRLIFAFFFIGIGSSIARAAKPVLIPQTGHQGEIVNACLNHSETLLATFGNDDNILVWDVASMKIFRRFSGYSSLFMKGGTLRFMQIREKEYLASFSKENYSVAIWDLVGDSMLYNWPIPDEIHPAGFEIMQLEGAPDQLLIYGVCETAILNPESGKLTNRFRIPKKYMDGEYPSKKMTGTEAGLLIKNRIHPIGHSGWVAIRNGFSLLMYDTYHQIWGESITLSSAFISLTFDKKARTIAILTQKGVQFHSTKTFAKTKEIALNTSDIPLGTNMRFSADGKLLFIQAGKSNSLIVDIEKQKTISSLLNSRYSDAFINEDKGTIITAGGFSPSFFLFNKDKYQILGSISPETFQFRANKITTCDNGRFLVFATPGTSDKDSTTLFRFDRSNLSIKILHRISYKERFRLMSGANNAPVIATLCTTGELFIFDFTGKNIQSDWSGKGKIRTIKLSNDGTRLWVGSEENTSGKTQAFVEKYATNDLRELNRENINNLVENPGSIYEFVFYNSDVVIRTSYRIFTLNKANLKLTSAGRSIAGNEFSYQAMAVAENGEVTAYTRDGNLIYFSMYDGSVKNKFKIDYSPYVTGILSLDNDRIILFPEKGMAGLAKVFNRKNKTEEWLQTGHYQDILDVTFTDQFIISSSSSGGIQFMNKNSLQTVAKMYLAEDEILLMNPDGYYSGSGKAINFLNFTIGVKSYNASLFELENNRYDKLLELIGKDATVSIKWYKRLYEKRLANNAHIRTVESVYSPDFWAELTNDPDLLSPDSIAHLQFKIHSNPANFSALHILVNDVPFNGLNGISASGNNTEINVDLPLSEFVNRIEYYVTDSTGRESGRNIFYQYYQPQNFKRKRLYAVVLSVGKYADSTYNLAYATKDGSDFIQSVHDKFGGSYDLKIFTAFDRDVNENTLTKMREHLSSARPDDPVFVYFSGHGLLDDRYQLYLGSHNMDFNNPANGGIPYAELETILEMCGSRKKIMLLDACHTGLVDADLKNRDFGFDSTQNSEGSRGGRSTAVVNAGERIDFNQMRSIYGDLSANSGLNVLAAAGGMEYAFESKKWNNGAFTFSLKKVLKDGCSFYDINGDDTVDVSEFFDAMSTMVEDITNGHQKPVSRCIIQHPFAVDSCDEFDYFESED
ncbi:MAG: hypothetical protein GC181_16350 [Bacteroidetes bacterium]|nr:hypothetical protein [Bacteroidota bacterium]